MSPAIPITEYAIGLYKAKAGQLIEKHFRSAERIKVLEADEAVAELISRNIRPYQFINSQMSSLGLIRLNGSTEGLTQDEEDQMDDQTTQFDVLSEDQDSSPSGLGIL